MPTGPPVPGSLKSPQREEGLGFPRVSRLPWLAGSLLLLVLCWTLLWTARSYWNPLFFFGLWTSATVLVRTLQGGSPLPLLRQSVLMALSMPLWWWFEFINGWAQNWRYHGIVQYNDAEYLLFASLAFSTVVPAMDAAWRLTTKVIGADPGPASSMGRGWFFLEIGLGAIGQALVFLQPAFFYPLIWVAPFLALDGILGLVGGVSLVHEMCAGRWRRPLAIGLAGVGCGFFWEMWNFWAMPKWTYSIPFFHFIQVFEMPLLGYLGYVPFALSVYQVVRLTTLVRRKLSAGNVAGAPGMGAKEVVT